MDTTPFCRRLLAVAAIALLAAPWAPADASSVTGALPAKAPQPGEGLRLIAVKQSLLGTHTWYAQTFRGLPVIDGYRAEHVDQAGRTVRVDDARLPVSGVPDHPKVTEGRARELAALAVRGALRSSTLAVAAPSRLVWSVVRDVRGGQVSVMIDATSAKVVEVRDLALSFDGTGRVFDPNPVVSLQDETLTDENDADTAAIQPAYRVVPLTHLDGSGALHGAYATIDSGSATSADGTFLYDRSDDRFEEVMAYFHVTSAQEYIQSLGFNDVNNQPQKIRTNAFDDDISYYDGELIAFGAGGVDDAEDADIIWHEYGHAIQGDQVPRFYGGMIGEGFGDWWAAMMSIPVNGGFDLPCIGDWNNVTRVDPPHCLRRVDTDLTMADRTGEAHHDGQIWSRALWDLTAALGRDRAARIVLEAQFSFTPGILPSTARDRIIETAHALDGSDAAEIARAVFAARGFAELGEGASNADAFRAAYARAGGASVLGEPAGPVVNIDGGCVQRFFGDGDESAIASDGCAGEAWVIGGELWAYANSRMGDVGFPVADAEQLAYGRLQLFDHGTLGPAVLTQVDEPIIVPGRTSLAVHVVSSCMYDLYASVGGPEGLLGYPVDDGEDVDRVRTQSFETGVLACAR